MLEVLGAARRVPIIRSRSRAAPSSTRAWCSATSSASITATLRDERVESALALVHQRFSTNTFPSWPLAHPYRFVCHNGEINTLRGNYNWMAARQANMSSEILGGDLEKLWPISYEGQSDTACFDNALELLFMGGYSLPHAMMMLIPEAWAGNPLMDEDRRAFYEYHAALMEPWDGPAAIAFTDGRLIGATLDRNGLRPARYLVTDDGLSCSPRRSGVLPIPGGEDHREMAAAAGQDAAHRSRAGRIVSDDEIEERSRPPRIPIATGSSARRSCCDDLPPPPASGRRIRCAAARSPAGLRLHPGRYQAPDAADGARPARKPSARWAPTRRSRRCPTSRSCSTPISSRTSPRSPTRRSIRSARSW